VPLGFVVLLYLAGPMSHSALAGETWSEIGHIQVLEGPENIWVFIEVVRTTDVLRELEAMTERAGRRNLYLHAVDALSRREGRQDIARGDAQRPTKSSDPFVSDKHQIKISVRESDELPGWRKLRRSSVAASSLSKSKPWLKTLVKVDTSGKQVRRASRGDGERVTNEPDETVFLGTVTRIDNLGHTPDPVLRYVVTLKIDKVIRGRLPIETFQLGIHSPSREGVELGHRYRISVRRSGARYDYCGPRPWRPIPPDRVVPK
jgi:hypothetical protein